MIQFDCGLVQHPVLEPQGFFLFGLKSKMPGAKMPAGHRIESIIQAAYSISCEPCGFIPRISGAKMATGHQTKSIIKAADFVSGIFV